MSALTHIDEIPAAAQGGVVAIGNFDGVHLGHRGLIAHAKRIAAAQKVPLSVITFEPHPRQFFQPDIEPFRLTPAPVKKRLLTELGVDHVFALDFSRPLASLSAQDFIDGLLVQKLQARHVVVGEGFAFGHKRLGTVETLSACSSFRTHAVAPVASPLGVVYSSTSARAFLRGGKFDVTEEILGWPWHIEMPVVHGDKRGRDLGFPTANQNVADYLRIPYGVYAVKALIEGEAYWRGGVANFGVRPMFEVPQPLFETYIFDFSGEIYGKILRVRPVEHLRPEQKFTSLDALVAQMKDDCLKAKAVLKSP